MCFWRIRRQPWNTAKSFSGDCDKKQRRKNGLATMEKKFTPNFFSLPLFCKSNSTLFFTCSNRLTSKRKPAGVSECNNSRSWLRVATSSNYSLPKEAASSSFRWLFSRKSPHAFFPIQESLSISTKRVKGSSYFVTRIKFLPQLDQ